MKTISTTIIGFTMALAAAGVSFGAQAPASNTTTPAPATKKHVKKHSTKQSSKATKPAATPSK